LETGEYNTDFHPMVDFIAASPLRLSMPCKALSKKISSSILLLIETTEEGTKILVTVDGKLRTVSESSIRRNLKLNDKAGISSLPDAKLFENLTLMGYNISPNQKFTFQKGQFSRQWKYLIHTIMQCLSPKRTPIEPHHTPISEASQHKLPSPSLPPVPTESLPTVIPSDNPLLGNIPEELGLVSPHLFHLQQMSLHLLLEMTVKVRLALLILDLEQIKTGMQQKLDELTALCTSLQRQQSEMVSKFAAQELEITNLKTRVKLLEDREGGGIAQSGDDALIKGRSLDEGEEAAKRVSDDTEEMATVLTSMDAASILTSGGVQVVPTAAEVATATVSIPSGSGVVPTASPTIPTAALIFTTATNSIPYTRRKGKEKMVESDTPKKKKLQEQIDIARDTEIARIHVEEELQIMIDGLDMNNETVAKYLQEYHQFATELPIGRRIELISDMVKYQDNYAKVLKYQTQQRKPLTRKQQREFYTSKQIQDFIPIGSKEEAERFKRKGLRLEQESVKKLKTSEEVKATEEVPEEKVKEMMQLVPVEEIIRLGGSSATYQFFMDMLKHLDREDLNQLWTLVKETLNVRPTSSDKEMEIWVELKRLFESNIEDQLWTHTQNMMHAPVEWKLYDTCEVHYVTSKDKEIFMLVEKDYPFRKGLAIIMISYKLQVENYSQMANDLILKIYKISNCLR
nr:hypothetical protein [Tanacetum cinerariifolium]